VDFGVCNNPEFLREGTAVRDFYSPPKTVIGSTDERSAQTVAALYAGLDAPLILTDLRTAEMAKYADNVWHALKVCFANELGNICKASGVDSHAVMDVFFHDQKLNLSKAYLTPGFAFGGSCLPKDVRALVYRSRSLDLETPVLNSIIGSNRHQIDRAADLVMQAGSKKVSVLGFSFKGGTDDLRESPMIEVIERLIGKGYELRVYDANVNLSNLIGANREYLLDHIPHISSIMVPSMADALSHGDTIVIGNYSDEFESVGDLLAPHQRVIDLVRIKGLADRAGAYEGICW
jgi:GDP-mannose 6-dehydrogenase